MSRKILVVSNTINEIRFLADAVRQLPKGLFEVVDEVGCVVAAFEKTAALRPDILILNKRLRHFDEKEFMRRLDERGAYPEIIFVDFAWGAAACVKEGCVLISGEKDVKKVKETLLERDAKMRMEGNQRERINGMRNACVSKAEYLEMLCQKEKKNRLVDVDRIPRLYLNNGKMHIVSIEISPEAAGKKGLEEHLCARTLLEICKEVGDFVSGEQCGEAFQRDEKSVHIILNDFKQNSVQWEKERFAALHRIAKTVARKEITALEDHEIIYYISSPVEGNQNIHLGIGQIEELHRYAFFMKGMNILDGSYMERCIHLVDKATIEQLLNMLKSGLEQRDLQAVNSALEGLFYGTIKYSMDFDGYYYACGRVNAIFNEALLHSGVHSDEVFLFYQASDDSIEQAIGRMKGNFSELVRLQLEQTRYTNPVIGTVVDYIKQHYNEPLTLTYIANKMHMSKSYLCYLFKQETGINLHHYIKDTRVKKAKEIICGGSKKIYQVAAAVGFENVRYFSTIFKDITGLSPVDYKKQMQRGEHLAGL